MADPLSLQHVSAARPIVEHSFEAFFMADPLSLQHVSAARPIVYVYCFRDRAPDRYAPALTEARSQGPKKKMRIVTLTPISSSKYQ